MVFALLLLLFLINGLMNPLYVNNQSPEIYAQCIKMMNRLNRDV
jgi:hypothetical protein